MEAATRAPETADDEFDDVLRAGVLEIHPREGLVVAGGRALTLSVRELGLLVELARDGRSRRRGARTSTRAYGARRCAPGTAPSTSTSASCA